MVRRKGAYYLSESAQSPLRSSFPSIIFIGELQTSEVGPHESALTHQLAMITCIEFIKPEGHVLLHFYTLATTVLVLS